jgi:RND family efflux transporter MFP subunit
MFRSVGLMSFCVGGALLLGSAAGSAQKNDGPPTVLVAKPVIQEVVDYEDFRGRVAANAVVKITPRVSGYIAKVLVKDGEAIKQGDVLFELDPRLQEMQVKVGKAEVAAAKAHHDLAKAELARAEQLAPTGGISRTELDQRKAQLEEAAAALDLARVKLTQAELALDWTRVTAPVDGKIEVARIPPGSFVKADSTVLATVVGSGPVLVDFDVDEITHLNVMRLAAQARAKTGKEEALPVFVRFPGETTWEHKGTVERTGTQVAKETGTVRWSAAMANSPADVLPGMSASVRLPIGKPHKAILISPGAIGHSAKELVWVVNDKNVTEKRQVELGRHHGGLCVITAGLTGDEWVVVDWQKTDPRTGITVIPQKVPMPQENPGVKLAK